MIQKYAARWSGRAGLEFKPKDHRAQLPPGCHVNRLEINMPSTRPREQVTGDCALPACTPARAVPTNSVTLSLGSANGARMAQLRIRIILVGLHVP